LALPLLGGGVQAFPGGAVMGLVYHSMVNEDPRGYERRGKAGLVCTLLSQDVLTTQKRRLSFNVLGKICFAY